jgi:hypothetical protein
MGLCYIIAPASSSDEWMDITMLLLEKNSSAVTHEVLKCESVYLSRCRRTRTSRHQHLFWDDRSGERVPNYSIKHGNIMMISGLNYCPKHSVFLPESTIFAVEETGRFGTIDFSWLLVVK